MIDKLDKLDKQLFYCFLKEILFF